MIGRTGVKHSLPAALPALHEADHARLVIAPGPWMEPQWAVVEGIGNVGRRLGTCDVTGCERDIYPSSPAGADLCYPHYTQWWRARRVTPIDVVQWLPAAKEPQQRNRSNSVASRVIDFESLHPLLATEIRYVVGQKITSGDWTSNRSLLDFLEALAAAARNATSLLTRRPEDWLLLVQQALPPSAARNAEGYNRTFFSTLHRALVVDPWAEDRWLWKECFEHLVHNSARTYNGHNINWDRIGQSWIREPVKDYARICLSTGSRSWGTVITWAQCLANLSRFLEAEGIEHPSDLDRSLFIDYIATLNQQQASKHTLSGANVAASVLSAVQDLAREAAAEGRTAGQIYGSEVFLRYGENVVEKTRDPRPYPDDIVHRIDSEVLVDPLLDESARCMLQITRWGGFRISELVTLPLDCLRHNGKNGYWVHYWMTKTRTWRRFPIPNDLATALLAQQARVREQYGDDAEYLFPSPKRSSERAGRVHPWSTSGFRNHVAASFVRNGITRSSITGEDISGGAIHRYRHTIGTALLNAGWAQHEVSDFLGHESQTMTSAYARILDETLVRKITDFHEATTRSNHDEGLSGTAEVDPAVERMRARFTYQLPDGGCTLPANQKCDIRDNPCADCAFFEGGGADVRPVHEDRRRRLKLHISTSGDPQEVALNQKALDHVDRLLGGAHEDQV